MLTLCLLLFISSLYAQQDDPTKITYQLPSKNMTDLVDAPWTPRISISPDNNWMLLLKYPGLPPLEEVAQPELRLAGLRINPVNYGPSRGWYYNYIAIRKIDDTVVSSIKGLPENARVSDISWSPDSKYIAFTVSDNNAIDLWLCDIRTATARKINNYPINAVHGSAYSWLSDSKTLLVLTVPEQRNDLPDKPLVPAGPIVQENIGGKAPARTYQDLLKNPYDEAVFEYYATTQIVKMTIDGNNEKIGQPEIITSFDPSPDGKYILKETIHRPFSYTLPYDRFPLKTEITDLQGNIIYAVEDLPLADNVPIAYGSERTGRRSVSWRSDVDATIYWVEAQDDGDAGSDAEARDKLFLLTAPFNSEPIPLLTLADVRFSGVQWGNDKLAIVTGWWWKNRNYKAWRIQPGKPKAEPVLMYDRSWEDRYNDPGTPLMKPNKYGRWVLNTTNGGNTIFLSGSGASSEGDRPFLDEYDLKTKKTKRLFCSEAPFYEELVRLIDPDKGLLLTRREGVSEQPNYFKRNIKNNKLVQLTYFPHPTPQLIDVHKEQIRYERADGVQLTATLYLPAGYSPDQGPLPMLIWAYPQEYKSASAASQVTDSPYRFVRISWFSPLLFLSEGYAVLDDPTLPIIGEGDVEPNDTYIEQLVSSAQAAVDEVVRRGVVDRNRIAIGGHSYGAFMTANLLAHSDIFRAGIARSGAYNRTLTPFGFQSEDRSLWEAPEVYFTMSPFMHADKINEPILLIHGEADNNSGTFPLQSERFYGALKGHGATVRLVMLPHESHSYRARESVMHMLWEMSEWLDKYVKNAPAREISDSK